MDSISHITQRDVVNCVLHYVNLQKHKKQLQKAKIHENML